MIIMTWIVMIFNILCGIIQFVSVFTGKRVSERVTSFVGFIVNCLTVMLCLFVIRI